MLGVLAASCFGWSASAVADMAVNTQTPVARVLACMRAHAPQALAVNELSIHPEENGRALPVLHARLYAQRGDEGLRAMLHLTAPADLAGTRYLLVERQPEDAFYAFLPAIGATRRVQGGGEDGEIAGTRLSYADLRLINQAVGGAAVSLEESKQIQNRAADVLRLAITDAGAAYRRVFVSVDRETCIALRIELHDEAGLAKFYEADARSLRRIGDYVWFEQARIEDLRRNTRAAISLRGVQTPERLSSSLFDPKRFHRSR